LVAKLAAADS